MATLKKVEQEVIKELEINVAKVEELSYLSNLFLLVNSEELINISY